MSAPALARSTHTVELLQTQQINERLVLTAQSGGPPLTAKALGLAGAAVRPWLIDLAAARVVPRQERRRESAGLPGGLPGGLPDGAALARLLAAGAPLAPYLYGVFAQPGGGRRELPVLLHTEHLLTISCELGLRRHLWGV